MSIESRSRQYGKVFDHWQIKEYLGSGSGGKTAVFRLVRSDSTRGVSALKVVNLIEVRGDINSLSEFRRKEYETARDECSRNAEQEVWLMDDLRGNTNIVDYLDHTFVDWSDETGFGRDLLIRMELLKDLRSELQSDKIFSELEALKIGRDICIALIRCHRKNILHRDVKPENIFRNNDGDYKLGDFGVSRVLDACPGAVASTGIGTYEYWPPEQMSGHYDKRVDVYSLGLVLYELCNQNRLPFATSSFATSKEVSLRLVGTPLPKPSAASVVLADVILKACAFNPDERYQSAEDLLKALNNVIRTAHGSGGKKVSDTFQEKKNSKAEYTTVPVFGSDVKLPVNQYSTMPADCDLEIKRKSYSTEPAENSQTRTDSRKKHTHNNSAKNNFKRKRWILLAVIGLCLAGIVFFGSIDNIFAEQHEESENGIVLNETYEESVPTEIEDTISAVDSTAVQDDVTVYDNISDCIAVGTDINWKNNILMKDRVETVIPFGGYRSSIVTETVFGSDIMRNDIGYVVFEDSIESSPSNCWDVSENQDSSVLAWVIPYDDSLYELHIAAAGGVNGVIACEDMFCGYANVRGIEFNNCFHTEETEDFSRMFYGCSSLTELSLSGIETDSAINLSEMFANCTELYSVDVSGFDTSNVEDTSGMFSKCVSLDTLDISGFDLFRVRDVSYMFFECPAAKGIQIVQDAFWFRNVDRYDHFMDEGVLVDGKPWITLFELDEVQEASGVSLVKTGEMIVFGRYEQDNNKSNGPEKVEWIVLDTQGDKILLMSRFALDSRPYNEVYGSVTWEQCKLRKWLNSTFLDAAFSIEEQDAIFLTSVDNGTSQGNPEWDNPSMNNTEDKVFLLSYADTEKYFDAHSDRICLPTKYAIANGSDVKTADGGLTESAWWWLRSPGENNTQASMVIYDGTRYTYAVGNEGVSVRPVIWVDMNKISDSTNGTYEGIIVNTESGVNIRSDPSVEAQQVGKYLKGTEIEILETTTINGKQWCRTEHGWISMDYVLIK